MRLGVAGPDVDPVRRRQIRHPPVMAADVVKLTSADTLLGKSVAVKVEGGKVSKAWSSGQMFRGVELILLGLFMKVVLADAGLANVADRVFARAFGHERHDGVERRIESIDAREHALDRFPARAVARADA